jgi:hypothetical protein
LYSSSKYTALEWEKEVGKLGKNAVAVITGASLSSHEAVTAIAKGIAVITDGEVPSVGDVISPTKHKVPEPNNYQLDRLVRDLCFFLTSNLSDGYQSSLYEGENYTAISTKNRMLEHQASILGAAGILQSCGLWDWSLEEIKLRAFAVSTIVRFVIAACVAESRHFYTNGPGRPDAPAQREPKLDWEELGLLFFQRVDSSGVSLRPTRDKAAEFILDLPPRKLWKIARQAAADLKQPGWAGSYGGDNWWYSAEHAVFALSRIFRFMDEPSQERWQDVVASTNVLLSVVHNGGAVLSKWVSPKDLNFVSNWAAVGLMSPAVGHVLLVKYVPDFDHKGALPELLPPRNFGWRGMRLPVPTEQVKNTNIVACRS